MEWKQVQNALLCATGPLCGLWFQIHEQGLDSEDGPIPASAVLDMIRRTLVFLGNANQLLSEKRRLSLLKSIDPNLTKYAKGEFPEAGKDLFGSKLSKEIVGHVEADTAICKVSAIVNKGFRSTSSKGKSPSLSKSDFFQWGWTGGMAPPPTGTISAYATKQACSEGEGEADTTSNRQAVSSAGWVQTPTQRTNMPNKSENKYRSFSRTHS